MNTRYQRWRTFCFLSLLCLLAYIPALLALQRGASPLGGDALSAFNPWHEFTKQAISGGFLPLWNPHIFCGMPFLANGQSALLYPVNIIYLLFPSDLAQLTDAYFHNVLLACGAYLLARALGLSRLSALLAASLLALGGAVSARVYGGHLTWHAVRAWIPWLLRATLIFVKTDSRKHGILAALIASLMLFAGHPQMTALGFALTGGLMVALLIARQCRCSLPWALAILVLAVALSAVSWLPLQEASQFGVRSKGLPYSFAVIGSGSWRSLLRLLMPDFFGGNGNLQWSMQYFPLEEAASLGMVPAVLALLSPILARVPRRDGSWRLPRAVPWLWATSLLALVLALGDNTALYRLAFEHLPLFQSLRMPVRWLELWFFCSAFLSGLAFEGCCQCLHANGCHRDATRILLGSLTITAVGCLALESWLMSQAPESPLWRTTAQWNAQRAPQAALDAATQLRWAAVFSSLGGFLIAASAAFLVWRWRIVPSDRKFVVERVFCTLMVAELLVLFWRSATPIEPGQVQSYIQWPQEIARFYQPNQRWDTALRGTWGEYGLNGGMPHGIDLFNGYDPFSPRRFFDFAGAMEGLNFASYQYQPAHRTALLRVAGVTHTLSAPDVGDGKSPTPSCDFGTPQRELTVQAWSLYRYSGAWPRAYLTSNIQRVPEQNQLKLLSQLAESDFDSQGHPAVVSPTVFQSIENASTSRTLPGEITNWKRTYNRVDFDVTLQKPAVLVYSENNYAGWRAYVTKPNPHQTPIEFANYLFRGVGLPTEARQVTMIYEPQTFRVSAFVSLLGISALVAMLISLLQTRHKS